MMSSHEKRAITADDLYNLQLITDTQLSPDGKHVVFALQRVDKRLEKKYTNLWVVSTETAQARQFTYGDQVDRQPRWSPDGNQIAFTSSRRNSKQEQFYLIPFHGGEARPLTDLKGKLGRYSWSPDGRRLVCLLRKKDAAVIEREENEQKKKLGLVARHITRLSFKEDGTGFLPEERWHAWLIDTTTGEATQLTDSDRYEEYDPSWSPDGQFILFRSNHAEDPDLEWDVQDLFIIPVGSGEARKLESPPGPKTEPSFSPDGQWIAYYSQGDRQALWRQNHLCLISTTGDHPPRNLSAAFDFDVSHSTLNDTAGSPLTAPTWSNDSQTLYFQVSHHGSTTLKSISLDGTNLQEVVSPAGAVGYYNFDQGQTKLAYGQAAMTDPGQIWLQDMTTGDVRQLTTVNQDWLDTVDLGRVEEVWYTGEAGHDLQGWILKPPGFNPEEKYPAILEIHGGPMLQYGHAFMHEFYFLAAQGYVVFYTNPRGGRGYGEAHTQAIDNNWGTADYADLMAWTDLVQQKPYIDETRLGVTGGSYGGYMTNWIISHTDRFQAAVTQRSVSNFISMFGSSDLHTRWQALFGADNPPWEDWENYWRQSPLKYFGNIKTPTLVMHSEQDMRCDIEQGEQVFVALKVLGVETELVRFPRESHGLSRGGRTDRRIVRLNHILRWFDKYLK